MAAAQYANDAKAGSDGREATFVEPRWFFTDLPGKRETRKYVGRA
jgi:hypothetical protein